MLVRSTVPADRKSVESLLLSVEATTQSESLSEHKRIRVLAGESIELVAEGPDGIVGYAQAAWHGGGAEPHWAIELVADLDGPSDVWRSLLDTAQAVVPQGRRRYLWISRSVELGWAAESGWRIDRTLHEMHRLLPLEATAVTPDGIEISRFRRQRDEEQWLVSHNVAFAGHPEVGGMTRVELERRLEQPWFDPDGLLLAWRDGRVVGSCWTKLHGDGAGEIYLIGIRPEAQGIGLGRALVVRGLMDLHERQGAGDGMLWVDEANTGAHSLYLELGFVSVATIYRMTDSR